MMNSGVAPEGFTPVTYSCSWTEEKAICWAVDCNVEGALTGERIDAHRRAADVARSTGNHCADRRDLRLIGNLRAAGNRSNRTTHWYCRRARAGEAHRPAPGGVRRGQGGGRKAVGHRGPRIARGQLLNLLIVAIGVVDQLVSAGKEGLAVGRPGQRIDVGAEAEVRRVDVS